MRLSTVFELLLIFLLIAFAAYGRVIDHDEVNSQRSIRSNQEHGRQENMGVSVISLKQATENVNKYCNCNENICNCCREFNIPLVSLKGPGCASLQYRDNDSLAVQLNFGDNILTSKVISGKKSQSICVPMLGGYSKFCGRIYSIERESDDHFKACLGLELQSSSELEASLRVSCFRFGPDGVKLRPAEQFPILETPVDADDDDDDDDDDIFGLDDDDDDDDDDDEDDGQLPSKNTAVIASATNQQIAESGDEDDDDDDDDDDLFGFGTLFDMITGDDDSEKKKTTTAVPILPFTIPILHAPTTGATVTKNHLDSVSSHKVNKHPNPTEMSDAITEPSVYSTSKGIATEKFTHPSTTSELPVSDSGVTTHSSIVDDRTVTNVSTEQSTILSEASNDVKVIVKPGKPLSSKRITVGVPHNKFSETSGSANAIKNDVKETSTRPTKLALVQKPVQHFNVDNDGDDDDDDDGDDEEDDDILGVNELNEDDYGTDENSVEGVDEDDETNKTGSESVNNEKPSNSSEEEDEHYEDDESLLDDDEDEEEDAVLSALVLDEKDHKDGTNKVAEMKPTAKPTVANEDYNVDLSDLLSKKRQIRRGRQSKVMRL